VLPEVKPSAAAFGTTKGLDFLPDGIPIRGVAGDQQAALFGQACFEPGDAKCTYGTGAFLLMNVGPRPIPSQRGLLTTVAWTLGEDTRAGNTFGPGARTAYALEGSAFIAGALVQWLRDGLGIIEKAADVEALALSVPDSGGVMLVPAFVGLGAPHWDAYARGTIVGMSRGTTAAHVARAAVEAIAYQSAELLAAMQKDADCAVHEVRADGGAARNDLLMQFQADLLGVPVVRPQVTETTALGAACLAGLAVGFWSSREEISARWRSERRFEPQLPAARRDEMMARWSRAVAHARAWAVPEHH